MFLIIRFRLIGGSLGLTGGRSTTSVAGNQQKYMFVTSRPSTPVQTTAAQPTQVVKLVSGGTQPNKASAASAQGPTKYVMVQGGNQYVRVS